eukprot:TRINITY_DN387_c0_g1_i1.p1 TRINITY_DN387_c0_g1~~TRINITY_DN387_c0_g1_i1.p1  ORF type:complete len:1722 (-),score=790.25 TRINITY_DN387_c0_g1_i1:239-5404(-)
MEHEQILNCVAGVASMALNVDVKLLEKYGHEIVSKNNEELPEKEPENENVVEIDQEPFNEEVDPKIRSQKYNEFVKRGLSMEQTETLEDYNYVQINSPRLEKKLKRARVLQLQRSKDENNYDPKFLNKANLVDSSGNMFAKLQDKVNDFFKNPDATIQSPVRSSSRAPELEPEEEYTTNYVDSELVTGSTLDFDLRLPSLDDLMMENEAKRRIERISSKVDLETTLYEDDIQEEKVSKKNEESNESAKMSTSDLVLPEVPIPPTPTVVVRDNLNESVVKLENGQSIIASGQVIVVKDVTTQSSSDVSIQTETDKPTEVAPQKVDKEAIAEEVKKTSENSSNNDKKESSNEKEDKIENESSKSTSDEDEDEHSVDEDEVASIVDEIVTLATTPVASVESKKTDSKSSQKEEEKEPVETKDAEVENKDHHLLLEKVSESLKKEVESKSLNDEDKPVDKEPIKKMNEASQNDDNELVKKEEVKENVSELVVKKDEDKPVESIKKEEEKSTKETVIEESLKKKEEKPIEKQEEEKVVEKKSESIIKKDNEEEKEKLDEKKKKSDEKDVGIVEEVEKTETTKPKKAENKPELIKKSESVKKEEEEKKPIVVENEKPIEKLVENNNEPIKEIENKPIKNVILPPSKSSKTTEVINDKIKMENENEMKLGESVSESEEKPKCDDGNDTESDIHDDLEDDDEEDQIPVMSPMPRRNRPGTIAPPNTPNCSFYLPKSATQSLTIDIKKSESNDSTTTKEKPTLDEDDMPTIIEEEPCSKCSSGQLSPLSNDQPNAYEFSPRSNTFRKKAVPPIFKLMDPTKDCGKMCCSEKRKDVEAKKKTEKDQEHIKQESLDKKMNNLTISPEAPKFVNAPIAKSPGGTPMRMMVSMPPPPPADKPQAPKSPTNSRRKRRPSSPRVAPPIFQFINPASPNSSVGFQSAPSPMRANVSQPGSIPSRMNLSPIGNKFSGVPRGSWTVAMLPAAQLEKLRKEELSKNLKMNNTHVILEKNNSSVIPPPPPASTNSDNKLKTETIVPQKEEDKKEEENTSKTSSENEIEIEIKKTIPTPPNKLQNSNLSSAKSNLESFFQKKSSPFVTAAPSPKPLFMPPPPPPMTNQQQSNINNNTSSSSEPIIKKPPPPPPAFIGVSKKQLPPSPLAKKPMPPPPPTKNGPPAEQIQLQKNQPIPLPPSASKPVDQPKTEVSPPPSNCPPKGAMPLPPPSTDLPIGPLTTIAEEEGDVIENDDNDSVVADEDVANKVVDEEKQDIVVETKADIKKPEQTEIQEEEVIEQESVEKKTPIVVNSDKPLVSNIPMRLGGASDNSKTNSKKKSKKSTPNTQQPMRSPLKKVKPSLPTLNTRNLPSSNTPKNKNTPVEKKNEAVKVQTPVENKNVSPSVKKSEVFTVSDAAIDSVYDNMGSLFDTSRDFMRFFPPGFDWEALGKKVPPFFSLSEKGERLYKDGVRFALKMGLSLPEAAKLIAGSFLSVSPETKCHPGSLRQRKPKSPSRPRKRMTPKPVQKEEHEKEQENVATSIHELDEVFIPSCDVSMISEVNMNQLDDVDEVEDDFDDFEAASVRRTVPRLTPTQQILGSPRNLNRFASFRTKLSTDHHSRRMSLRSNASGSVAGGSVRSIRGGNNRSQKRFLRRSSSAMPDQFNSNLPKFVPPTPNELLRKDRKENALSIQTFHNLAMKDVEIKNEDLKYQLAMLDRMSNAIKTGKINEAGEIAKTIGVKK